MRALRAPARSPRRRRARSSRSPRSPAAARSRAPPACPADAPNGVRPLLVRPRPLRLLARADRLAKAFRRLLAQAAGAASPRRTGSVAGGRGGGLGGLAFEPAGGGRAGLEDVRVQQAAGAAGVGLHQRLDDAVVVGRAARDD